MIAAGVKPASMISRGHGDYGTNTCEVISIVDRVRAAQPEFAIPRPKSRSTLVQLRGDILLINSPRVEVANKALTDSDRQRFAIPPR